MKLSALDAYKYLYTAYNAMRNGNLFLTPEDELNEGVLKAHVAYLGIRGMEQRVFEYLDPSAWHIIVDRILVAIVDMILQNDPPTPQSAENLRILHEGNLAEDDYEELVGFVIPIAGQASLIERLKLIITSNAKNVTKH